MDSQKMASFDSYFTYGFRVFVIVTVVTSIICAIIWLNVGKKIRRYNENHPGHEAPVRFVSSAVRYAFFIIGLLIVMNQVKAFAPLVEMIFSAGSVLALCTTFAAKKSFSNYISGFLISLHRPYVVGDRIVIQHQSVKERSRISHSVIRSSKRSREPL